MKNRNLDRRDFLKSIARITAYGGFTFMLGTSFSSCQTKESKENLLRLQSPWINDAEFIGYFIAMQNGYYEEEGIDFEYLSGGPEIIADSILIAKKAEIALTTPDVTINAIVRDNIPLKIIGTQYQKNPLGIVSLEKNNIKKPKDLIGKTLAAPPANFITVKAFLLLNGIDEKDVRVVPYQYDPSPLINGEVDATLDFVTNVPFSIREKGETPTSFLLYDYGFKIFNDTVVVREETLLQYRKMLQAWLRASKKGWEENFKDVGKYPPLFEDTYFSGTGRTIENEIYFNTAQQDLIESTGGIFSMSESAISDVITSLEAVGIKAKRDMFVNDLI